jgi:hypothetical protein
MAIGSDLHNNAKGGLLQVPPYFVAKIVYTDQYKIPNTYQGGPHIPLGVGAGDPPATRLGRPFSCMFEKSFSDTVISQILWHISYIDLPCPLDYNYQRIFKLKGREYGQGPD